MSDPKQPGDPEPDDDWGAAVDEWDANLDLPVDPNAPKAEAAAPTGDAVTPIPGDGPDVHTPIPGEGPKLSEPLGLPEPPSVPPEEDDPLLHLFDGEMALPDSAGEALGPMLGDPPEALGAIEFGPPQGDALPAELADLELDWDGEGPTADHVKESLTPVLQPMERQGLVDLDAEVAAFDQEHQPVMVPNIDPGYDDDEVEVVVVDDGTSAPTTPVSAAKVAPELPRPRAAPETLERFRRQLAENDDEPPTTPLKPVVLQQAAPPDDDDDYADISIDASAAADEYEPAPPPPVTHDEDSFDFGLPDEKPALPPPPLSEDTIVMQSAPLMIPAPVRSSEPTVELDPFDVLDQTAAAILPSGSDPLAPAGVDPAAHPAVSVDEPDAEAPPSKLPSGLAAIALTVPAQLAEPKMEGADYYREQEALLDGERFLCQDPERSAELAYAAGRAAERAGDRAEARNRYETAIDASPGGPMALRGLRRIAVAERKLDEAQALLEREAERVSDRERPGVVALRAEILLAAGEREAARALYRDPAAAGDLRALSGLVDAAAAEGPSESSSAATAAFADRVRDARLLATLRAEVARIAEAGGTDAVAAAGYRRALESDPESRAASFGLLRIALRGNAADELAAAYARVTPLVGGAIGKAVTRRFAAARLAAGDAAGAADALAGDQDRATLDLRARAEARAGRDAAAAASLEQLATLTSDGAARADVLLELGELHERGGAYPAARDAYQRAVDGAPGDVPSALGIERIDRASGDVARLVDRARAAAADPALAETMRLRAARMLVGLGRSDEAIVELDAALALSPPSQAALVDRVELALAAGKPADAARALGKVARAATEAGDGESAMLFGERAARLYARAGETGAAIDEARLLVDGDLAPTARRHLTRLLAASPGREGELADALSVDAETTPDRARAAALWHLRGLTLESRDADGASESQRRALALTPGHSPSLLALALRATVGDGRADLVAPYRARLDEASGRAEAIALHLRVGALHEELADHAAATQSYSDALAALPDGEKRNEAAARSLSELLAVAARRSGDLARAVELQARFADGESDPDERFARHVHLAEQCELRLGRTDAAGEHYHKALALRPQSPLALPGLVRAFKAAGRYAVLAEMALGDLKEATDVARRVAAYEQLAILDGEHRGDPQSALMSYSSITQIDHSHHTAFRQLEKHFLKEQAWPELVVLYEQLGLTATDPSLATAVILDRARLREAIGGQENNVDNDFRQALFKNPRSRPALRRVLAAARVVRDPSLTAELCLRLADSPEVDGLGASVLLMRAAESLIDLARVDEGLGKLNDAVARDPGHLPAARSLGRLGVEHANWASAVAGAEAAGRVLRDPVERMRAWLTAGALAQDQLGDDARALESFRQVLQSDPRHLEAFQRVRALLDKSGHAAALAQALAARVEVESDPARLLALHLELATLQRDRLNDREQAKIHLRKVLATDGGHVPALTALSDLYYGDGQWAEAADTLIRRARVEKTPQVLRDVFFKLGLIYSDHLPDAKRAVVSFTRVLQIEPENRIALEYLSNLSVKEREWKGALGATARLAELESDPVKKVGWLHRAARIHEEGFKDSRQAHDALRRALDVDLRYLPAIGELAKFYDRQGDATSSRVHLDRSAQAMRAVLARDPNDLGALHGLFRVFSWRRSIDQAFTVAALLNARGAADDEEKALLARFATKDFYPGSALGDLSLDEQLFHPTIPPGFRHLFRLLDESLQKAFRSDLRRLGVGKQERLPKSGHTVREIANRLAADIGVRDFDLYVTAALPTAVAIELTEPVAIIVGAKLVEGAHEKEVIFHLGGALRMLRSQMAVALRMNADELGILVGGVVRQFVPDFVPKGFDEAMIAAEAGKLARVVPKKLHQELVPFALECADPGLDLRTLSPALGFTQARAGLLACGSIAHAVAALRKRGDEAQSRELLRFAVADELADLRRAVGTAIG